MRARDHRSPPGRAPGGMAGARPDGSGDRFGLLLLLLIATYIMSSFLTATWVYALQIVLFLGVTLLAVRTSRAQRRAVLVMVTVTLAGSAVALALALTNPGGTGAGLANLWTGLVLLFAVGLIVRRVLAHQVITLQSIFGAVSAYMIIGLMFAAYYAAINRLGAGGFFGPGRETDLKTFQYFSFTTLTTLGYGDFTAAGSGGRSVAVMEALLGQVFLATLVARLVAAFRPGDRAARERSSRRPVRRRAGRTAAQTEAGPDRRRFTRERRQPGSARRISSRARERRAHR